MTWLRMSSGGCVLAPRAPLCTRASQRESQHRRPLWSVIIGFLKRRKVSGRHLEK